MRTQLPAPQRCGQANGSPIPTPAFPAYVSGHSAFTAAWARAMELATGSTSLNLRASVHHLFVEQRELTSPVTLFYPGLPDSANSEFYTLHPALRSPRSNHIFRGKCRNACLRSHQLIGIGASDRVCATSPSGNPHSNHSTLKTPVTPVTPFNPRKHWPKSTFPDPLHTRYAAVTRPVTTLSDRARNSVRAPRPVIPHRGSSIPTPLYHPHFIRTSVRNGYNSLPLFILHPYGSANHPVTASWYIRTVCRLSRIPSDGGT